MPTEPETAAKCNGRIPPLVGLSTCALTRSSILTTASCLYAAATCSAL